jgi:hypothetical protein
MMGLVSGAVLCAAQGVDHVVLGGSGAGVRERRGALAADDRRGLMDEVVVHQSFDHE